MAWPFFQYLYELEAIHQIRINMKNCGICGSDIHYFLHGENGGRKIKEPLMLGHETVGEIIEVGKEVSKFKIDDISKEIPEKKIFLKFIFKFRLLPNILVK